jgi:predicted MFS family arabinose efflux permease
LLLDRQSVGRQARRPIQCSGISLAFIAAFGLFTALLSLTPRSPTVFFVLCALWGFAGSGQASLPYSKAISAWFEDRRGLALGLAMGGVGLGTAIVPHVARFLIDKSGWRSAYLGLGLTEFVVAFPAVALFVHDNEKTASGNLRKDVSAQKDSSGMNVPEALWGSYPFLIISMTVLLVSCAINGTIVHIVPMLMDLGFTSATATSVLALTGPAMIVGRVLVCYLLDHFFAPYVSAVVFLFPGMGTLLFSAGDTKLAAMGAIFIGLGLGAELNSMAFCVSRYFGLRSFGQIFGFLFGILVLGSSIGPWAMGTLFDRTGSYAIAMRGCLGLLVCASLLISRLGPYVYPSSQPGSVSVRAMTVEGN